ncbi:hypothetical protein HDEF_0334 [Candidatus Hamiltonella defensa 5AT (Acyrthosiphon pisum)]|uniref:Uncharacterized protein n=1 Tax=Hamiltonella defensa subsp. Acyrthosiphon pisum (strain 5AT) TaxID=572265 RepID=C4K3F3_HAMD5|nr:hypothetical protein HDEF_0334 [Candidatus Hamiltonella defensa 5AT (Acyrthosiphon pisum)]
MLFKSKFIEIFSCFSVFHKHLGLSGQRYQAQVLT